MLYEEFLGRLAEANINYEMPILNERQRYREKDWKPKYGPEQLRLVWSTGGVSGGSCSDSSNPTPYSNDEPEPEFESFNDALTAVCPKLTFIDYGKLLKSGLIETDSYTDYEYYGNCTSYSVKWVELKKLFNYLVQKKLI
jgi:hypothetical protein